MRISDWSSDVCSSDLPIRELENVEDTLRPVVVIEQHALRGAVEVLVLTALERPEKSNKAHDAEAERNRDQIGEHAHWVASRAAAPCRRTRVPFVAGRYLAPMPRLSRVALATTRIEEADIANAATSGVTRSEEHTSELQSLMRISYAVFCLKKKN